MGEHAPWLKHDARKVFDELDTKVLETVQTRGEGNATSDECSLLWLDDCGADLKTGGPRLAKQLRKLAWNRRHLRTSVCACVQASRAVCPFSIQVHNGKLGRFDFLSGLLRNSG